MDQQLLIYALEEELSVDLSNNDIDSDVFDESEYYSCTEASEENESEYAQRKVRRDRHAPTGHYSSGLLP